MDGTCKACFHKQMIPDPNRQNQLVTVCTRYPPTVYPVPTNQGLAFVTTFPHIADNSMACGEYDDNEEEGPGVNTGMQ